MSGNSSNPANPANPANPVNPANPAAAADNVTSASPIAEAVITHYRGDKDGAFSMTCDDGFRSEVADTLATIDPLGIKATFFIIPLYMENPDQADKMVTWEQVRQMHAAGHEIGTHGAIKEKLHEVTPKRLGELINGSHDLILEKAGIDSVSYATPGGSRATPAVRAVIYQKHLVFRGSREFPEKRNQGYGSALKRVWEDQEARDYISSQMDSGNWVVAIVHSIVGGWSPFKSREEFREHCQWLASQRDRLWIAPIGEVGLYLKARKAALLEMETCGDGIARGRIVCQLKPVDTFKKVALTVKIPVAGATQAIAKNESGSELPTQIKDDCILVDVSAADGTFTLKWK